MRAAGLGDYEMTDDEINKLYQAHSLLLSDVPGYIADMVRHVIAIEREACAKVCEEPAMMAEPYSKLDGWLPAAEWCASAIRMRGIK